MTCENISGQYISSIPLVLRGRVRCSPPILCTSLAGAMRAACQSSHKYPVLGPSDRTRAVAAVDRCGIDVAAPVRAAAQSDAVYPTDQHLTGPFVVVSGFV